MALKFQDPPPDAKGAWKGRKSKWAGIAEELRSRPGEWALVGEQVSASVVTMIKSGRAAGMAAGEFAAIGRNTNNATHRCDVYARYIGGADA